MHSVHFRKEDERQGGGGDAWSPQSVRELIWCDLCIDAVVATLTYFRGWYLHHENKSIDSYASLRTHNRVNLLIYMPLTLARPFKFHAFGFHRHPRRQQNCIVTKPSQKCGTFYVVSVIGACQSWLRFRILSWPEVPGNKGVHHSAAVPANGAYLSPARGCSSSQIRIRNLSNSSRTGSSTSTNVRGPLGSAHRSDSPKPCRTVTVVKVR